MSGLKNILQQTVERRSKLGGAVSSEVVSALKSYRERLFYTFIVIFVVLIFAVGLAAFGLASFIKEPTQIAAFAGAMGLSVGGAIEMLRRTWNEWSQTTLLLILVQDASEAQIVALVDKIIQRL